MFDTKSEAVKHAKELVKKDSSNAHYNVGWLPPPSLKEKWSIGEVSKLIANSISKRGKIHDHRS